MKRLRCSSIAALLMVNATLCCFAADRDFDGLVRDVAHRYDVHATQVPMMGFVSLCARFATHGGVRGLHIVEFDDVRAAFDVSELAALVRHHLGAEWKPFIQEHDQQGKSESIIFVREKGDTLGMTIADFDHGELDVLRMELSGDALAKWMKDPQGEAHHRSGRGESE